MDDNQMQQSGATFVIGEGVKIAGILFLWLIFAGLSALIADAAPRGSIIIPLARGLIWFFVVVGLANVLSYIVINGIHFHHQFDTT